jgi:hypothetical protein
MENFIPQLNFVQEASDHALKAKMDMGSGQEMGSPISRQVKKHRRCYGNSSCSLYSTLRSVISDN